MKGAIVTVVMILVLFFGIATLAAVVTKAEAPIETTTTTIDHEYARCMAIETHRSVLDYRDLDTARYLADVACNDGKVRIP